MIALMFDSNIWDKLVNDSQALLALEAYVQDGRIEVLTTSIQEKENESAPSHVKWKLNLQQSRSFHAGRAPQELQPLPTTQCSWLHDAG